MKYIRILFVLIIIGGLGSSCKKFLEEKPNQQLSTITSVKDLQSLLDDANLINSRDPASLSISSDDYYVRDYIYNAVSPQERNLYGWEKSDLFREGVNDWVSVYKSIYISNLVLDNTEKINRTPGDQSAWNNTKGHALALRAYCFSKAVSVWAPAYDRASAATELGVPLRLDPDFLKPSVRASVEECYQQILRDAKEAAKLLPPTSSHPLKPSRAAAYAILANVYLNMAEYDSAAKYAGLSLADHDDLLDFNTVNTAMNFSFSPQFSNPEIIWDFSISFPFILYIDFALIDSTLVGSYEADDLRRQILVRSNADGTASFKGSYEGSYLLFSGLATDEVLLTRAESFARTGQTNAAMDDLNRLLRNRYVTGTYVDRTAADAETALNMILQERRKELVMRGTRWMDLKRLNKEGRNITLQRYVNNTLKILEPNSKRYVLPIPEDVIRFTGMVQNER